jgi:cytochrome P450
MTANRSIAELPGPRGLPLLGNAHRLIPLSRTHLAFEELGRKYGPIFRVSAGPRMVIGIGDADAINAILRDRPEGFRRWSDQRRIIEEMNDSVEEMRGSPPGVFIAEGEEWKRQRRLVITALNTNHLHRYFNVVRTATERLHQRLLASTHDASPVSISNDLTSFTVDVTSALAFGYDLNTLEHGDGALQGHLHHVLKMTARRMAAPVPYWRRVKLPADRALDRSMAEIYEAIKDFIACARARMEARPELFDAPENLIEGLLATQRDDASFTDQQIASNLITILLAGEDTTARTLGWTIWLLASRPDIQQRLAAEGREAFGEHPFATEYEATESLAYTEAVLRESMRLKSVGPLMVVEPVEDKTICGTSIPAGTRLVLLLRQATRAAAGRSEDFYPERWLEDSDGTRAPKSLSFGAGPRFCPGRNLAFLESKAALGMLVRNFEFELAGRRQVRESFGFTMIPSGLRVRLRLRR